MGSTKARRADASFAAAYDSPCKLDVRSFEGSRGSALDEVGSSSGSNENISPELGLAVTSTNMEANSFNLQSMAINSTTYNCSAGGTKGLKKPDKALPCPRCNSLDTKFCYYNNYNVNQPRHFCKGCQRYWTAGGTLRNVAVGAGRRKRKQSSLDSEDVTEASSVECHSAQDFSTTRSAPANCKSGGDTSTSKDPCSVGYGVGDLACRKLTRLLFDANSFVSDNLLSSKLQGGLTHELIQAQQCLTSQHSSVPLRSIHDNRKQASVFHEFMHSKYAAAFSDKHMTPCNSDHEHGDVSMDHLKVSSKHFINEPNNVDSQLVLATPSERQASNESGCASSVTTQAVSVDACTNYGMSDTTDSEISKEGENCDKGGFMASEAHHVSSKVAKDRPTMCDFSQGDVTGAATLAPTALPWKGPVENPAFGAALAMLSMPLSWGSTTERGLLWGLPWGPTASAIDAAKAALMSNTRALQKPPSEPWTELAQKSLTASDKVSEKSGVEPSAHSEMRVWVPKTLRIKDADEAARSSIWSTLGIKDRQGSLVSGKSEVAFQCHAKEVGISAVKTQNANPAALSHSMAFQENS